MSKIANTRDHYGSVSIALHWLMAVLLVGLSALGLYMVTLPDVGFDTKKIWLIIYHKEIGVAAFILAVARLAWRITNALPRLVENLPEWQQIAARFVHLSFYVLMAALPISGWLMSSATGIPVSFLGLFALPDLVPYDRYLFELLVAVHQWLAYALLVLIAIHAGAALRHHFIFGDHTLRKMLPAQAPGRRRFSPPRTGRSPSMPSP